MNEDLKWRRAPLMLKKYRETICRFTGPSFRIPASHFVGEESSTWSKEDKIGTPEDPPPDLIDTVASRHSLPVRSQGSKSMAD
ncbi:hypothetical protein KIN20_027378 [Parelaphostrongylus tenuis]|uniref:Uncharacterized protein n=1 Tax=Parelaphostrongylus tenuis TaxID=148309 RepID=A0AAD5WE23_PARTN|nr:hypothetical protein KIN20_027378 [Parelaphostrongylus tenuis]